MRILIFGGNGMLGHKLLQVLREDVEVWTTLRGSFADVEAFDLFEKPRCVAGVDVENVKCIRRAIVDVRPDVVINAVGIVKQRPSAKDTVSTLTVNSIFPHRLNELAAEFGFRLFCVSTDCVFDGVLGKYSESDVSNATDLYGKSKNLGEVISNNCLTLRTSIIGRELQTSHSLVEWFMSNRGKSVKGFSNAIYSGFPTIVLADIMKSLILDHPAICGLYHVSSDPIDKYELLQLTNIAYRLEITIERDECFRIDRSLDSTKFRNATGFVPASWETMIGQMANDPTPYELWRKRSN
ncbi:MAG: SDR family oxidoreductase [Pyrinomonadaceae bacterium]